MTVVLGFTNTMLLVPDSELVGIYQSTIERAIISATSTQMGAAIVPSSLLLSLAGLIGLFVRAKAESSAAAVTISGFLFRSSENEPSLLHFCLRSRLNVSFERRLAAGRAEEVRPSASLGPVERTFNVEDSPTYRIPDVTGLLGPEQSRPHHFLRASDSVARYSNLLTVDQYNVLR